MTERVWRCCNSFPCVCGYNAGNAPPWPVSSKSEALIPTTVREEVPTRGCLPDDLRVVTSVYRNVSRVILSDWNFMLRIHNDPGVATEIALPQIVARNCFFNLLIKEIGGVETTVRIAPASGDKFEGSDIPQSIVMPRYSYLTISPFLQARTSFIV